MKKAVLSLILILSAAMSAIYISAKGTTPTAVTGNETVGAHADPSMELYRELGLSGLCRYEAFEQAIKGYDKIQLRKKDILVIIDFSKPSDEERMFVVNVPARKLVHHTHVAHGRNSGERYATAFSNKPGSHQSSLGFYLTGSTYQGGNGYSLLLDGLEKGINDKARERSIVIHSAAYADPDFIRNQGRLGRSFGCPSLPTKVSGQVIDTIKDGALLFIYADNPDYEQKSTIIDGNS